MRRRSRTRWVLKWIGTAFCALLGALWASSAWYSVSFGPTARLKQEWLHWEPIPRNWEGVTIVSGTVTVTWVRQSCRQEFLRRLSNLPQPYRRLSSQERAPLACRRIGAIPKFGLQLARLRDISLQRQLVLPLWIPFVIVAICTTLLWWAARRPVPPGHCKECGYDLTANVSGRCPECGTATDPEAV